MHVQNSQKTLQTTMVVRDISKSLEWPQSFHLCIRHFGRLPSELLSLENDRDNNYDNVVIYTRK